MQQLEDIHIGKLIKEQLKIKRYSTAKLAEKIGCQRQNIYDIFRRKSIDTDMLVKISQELDYDFLSIVYGPLMPGRTIKKTLVFEIEGDHCTITCETPAE